MLQPSCGETRPTAERNLNVSYGGGDISCRYELVRLIMDCGIRVGLFPLVGALARALDLVSREVSHHHARVACLTDSIALELRLPAAERRNLLLAALLHDAGALSLQGRLDALQFETDGVTHARAGYALLGICPQLRDVAELVLHHHTGYQVLARNIGRAPMLANVINLADRLDVSLPRSGGQAVDICATARGMRRYAGSLFHPDYVEALCRAVETGVAQECFTTPWGVLGRLDPDMMGETLDSDGLFDFASVFSQVIDFRSRFTATHSSGVAACAAKLGQLAGFSHSEQAQLYLAGLLHDVGKLAISSELLEKPGPLTEEEFARMKRHPEYTAEVLGEVPGLERVSHWASHHHERVNGSGYPYGRKGGELELGARIMAVADIFTALSEDRPYRSGMTREQAHGVLTALCNEDALDPVVANLLFTHYDELDDVRLTAQSKALKEFRAFAARLDDADQ